MNAASTTRQRNNRPPPPGDPSLAGTIDLHGLRKQDAVGRLTTFLSDVTMWKAKRGRGCTAAGGSGRGYGPVWVCVVTGSGSHSSSGPVIRTAVSNLLTKRGMIYFANRGGGSFTVDAASGIELCDDPRTRYVDTKVLLKHRSGSAPDLVNPAMRNGRGGGPVGGAGTGAGARSLPGSRRGSDSSTVMAVFGVDGKRAGLLAQSSDRAINGDSAGYSAEIAAPSPAEVAADDALLRHARSASAAEASRHRSQRRKEEREMQRVLSESKLLRERDEEGRRELQRALARSVDDTEGASEVDAAEDVERAIRESVALAEMEAAEREAVERVVAGGGGGGGHGRGGGATTADVGFAGDGDGAVQRAIHDSLDLAARWQRLRQEADSAGSDPEEEEIRRAIQESLASAPRHDSSAEGDDEEAMERAIRESLASAASETYDRMSSRNADEDEMIERALRESLTLTATPGPKASTEDEDDRYRDRQKDVLVAAEEEERRRTEVALQRSMAEARTREMELNDDGGDVVLYPPGSGTGFFPATAAPPLEGEYQR